MGNCVQTQKKTSYRGNITYGASNFQQGFYGDDGYNVSSYTAKAYPLDKDDEPLVPIQPINPDHPPYMIRAALSFGWGCFKPKMNEHHSIPCALILTDPDQPANQRVGVDIICVIDVSGSMSGEKLDMVKRTNEFYDFSIN